SAPDFSAPTDVGADNVYNVIVQVSDGLNSDTQALAVTVLKDIAAVGLSIGGTEGASTGSVRVATFTDSNPNAIATDFSATIDWGDGTTSSGTIATNSGGGFAVSGAHAYAEEGAHTVAVSIADKDGSTAKVSSLATVADAALAAAGLNIGATEGASTGAITVATFTDPNPTAASGDFQATINWGDGTTSTGTVSVKTDGSFAVNDAHTYSDEGQYKIAVVIADDGGSTALTSSIATVADADVLTSQGTTIAATANQALTNVVVAHFTDAYVSSPASDFAATINWGDGSTSTGAVTGANGTFTVSGSHTYASPGQDTLTVTMSEVPPGSATATATSTVNVTAQQNFTPGIAGEGAGFWAGHFLDWDGFLGDDPNAKNLVSSGALSSTDVLYALSTHGRDLDGTPQTNPAYGQIGVLLGDANADGRTDNGERTLFVPLLAAEELLLTSSDSSVDVRQALIPQAIASQLNIDNGDKDPGFYPGQSAGHDL